MDDIYSTLNTGDLIYFKYTNAEWYYELVTPFTHIGMVVKINNELYILESHVRGATEIIGMDTEGVNLYPLKLRIQTYKGHVFASKLNSEFMPDNKRIEYFMSRIDYYKSIPFKNDSKQFFIKNCITNKYSASNPTGSLMCSEFIGLCLKDLGILDPTFNYICVLPGDFQYLKKNNKRIFEKYVKILP
jgi:hypothetical protein